MGLTDATTCRVFDNLPGFRPNMPGFGQDSQDSFLIFPCLHNAQKPRSIPFWNPEKIGFAESTFL